MGIWEDGRLWSGMVWYGRYSGLGSRVGNFGIWEEVVW